MFVALILVSTAVLGGAVLTYFFDAQASLWMRLCTGTVIGFGTLAFEGFVAAFAFPFHGILLLVAGLACACPLVLLARRDVRKAITSDISKAGSFPRTRAEALSFISCCAVGLFLSLVFRRIIFEKPDGLYTGFVNNLGDLPFHLQIIASFVHSDNFPPTDPTYAGSRLTYPFLVDFVAALFVRGGASLRAALMVENLLLSLALVGVFYRWTVELTKDRIAGMLAPFLLLFSGGFGWWLFLRDAVRNPRGMLATLAHPAQDYTIANGTTWRWGNAMTTLLVPQRSLLFGLPVAIVIFTQWWLFLSDERRNVDQSVKSVPMRHMIAAGVLAGLLPLIHTHTWMVVMLMASCLTVLFGQWRAWAIFFVMASALSLPQVWWMMQGSAVNPGTFLAWHFGWDNGGENAIWFWIKNTGMFIPLLIAAVLWRGKEHLIAPRFLRFYAPFVLCFLVPNAVKLAPWIWDNIKVLFYWYVASVPLVALLLARWLRGRLLSRFVGGALLASLTLAGGLDIWRAISGTTEFREFDRQDMTVANLILQRTDSHALILHAPTFNSLLYLTGRPSLLGYPGWIWSRGMDSGPRERAVDQIYVGSPQASALIQEYGVDYVLAGPAECSSMPVNNPFFSQYPTVIDAGRYRLYQVKKR